MNKLTSKLLSVLIILSMLFGLTSCDLRKKDKEAIYDIADKYSDGICTINYLRLNRLSSDDCSREDLLKFKDLSLYEEAESKYFDRRELIADVVSTFAYEIDEESYAFSERNKACDVIVTFTLTDVDAITSDFDATKDRETFLSLIPSYTTANYELTLHFVKEDGSWAVQNIKDVNSFVSYVFDSIMAFDFHPDLDVSMTNSSWSGASNRRYSKTRTLTYNLDFIDDVSDSQISSITYEILCDGEVIYEGDFVSNSMHDFHAEMNASDSIRDDGNGYFLIGDYEIVFYDGDGNEFYRDNCSVTADSHVDIPEEIPEDPPEESGFDCNFIPSGHVRYFESESDFYLNTSPIIFCDVSTLSQVFSYDSGRTSLQFVCEAQNGYSEPVNYTWYYAPRDDFNDAVEVYSGVCNIVTYVGHRVYYFELAEGTSTDDIPDGTYWCVLSSADGSIYYAAGSVNVG